jgi:hypothetical protein
VHRLIGPLALGASLTMALSATAAACSIDGKPSVFANNVPAVIGPAPTVASYATWAHFAFPHAFKAGAPIHFRENDAQIRRVLPPMADLHRPWRWRFGDGASQVADRVRHVFRYRGRYRVSVDAYFPHYGWEQFDSVTVTIQ